MKLLLDECVTNYLKPEFVGHEVSTIDEAGFKGQKNGKLLAAASGRFDVLVTVDQNLQFQQNLQSFQIAVLLLKARLSTYPMLMPLIPRALKALETIEPGKTDSIGTERWRGVLDRCDATFCNSCINEWLSFVMGGFG